MILSEGLTDRVARCLARHEHAVDRHGVPDGGGLVVACSGGVDSTALAVVIADLRKAGRVTGPIVLAHIHHGSHPHPEVERARERAAARVAELAKSLDLDHDLRHLGPWDRPPSEAALRDARYSALVELAGGRRIGRVLTAHHADDDVETILLRLMRGTGPNGLCGVPERRVLRPGIVVLRPLLDVRSESLRLFCRERRTPWIEDPTNRDRGTPRNALRHDDLPSLRAAVGSHLDMSVLALRQAARASRDLLTAQAQRLIASRGHAPTAWRFEFSLLGLDESAAPFVGEVARAIHQRLHPSGDLASSSWLERVFALCRARTGTRLDGARGIWVERTASGLLFVDRGRQGEAPSGPVEVPLPSDWRTRGAPSAPTTAAVPARSRTAGVGTDSWPLHAIAFGTTEWRMAFTMHGAPPIDPAPDAAGRHRALLDPEALHLPLRLRSARPGDRMVPLGSHRPSALRRQFQSRRIPRFDRDRIPLLVDSSDRILWLPGAEIHQEARVRPETGATLEVELSPRRPNG